MKKIINVNELKEILSKHFGSDFCHVEGIEIVTEGRTPYNPQYIEIGPGRVLNIRVDLGGEG